jgi:glycine/D-amino acid oxidase-like deaminating enzyme
MGAWGARVLDRAEARAEVASDFYRGGLLIRRSGLLHPALYYRGLLEACRARGIPVCTHAPVTAMRQAGSAWHLATARGECAAGDVIVATNGYTGEAMGRFRRRVVPIGSYVIATEELPSGMVRSILPNGRSVYDSRRVLSYCRPSPDGRRFLFGGRVRFGLDAPAETALPLHELMVERFPQLKGVRITHAWTGNLGFTFDETPHVGRLDGLHFALGCNGTGIAMMTWLGTKVARGIARANDGESVFGETPLPTHPLYRGNPWFVPAVGRYFKARDTLDRLLAR